MRASSTILGALVALTLFLVAAPAFAYVGPGSGLVGMVVLIAVVAAVFVAFVGFLWFPIKRMLKKSRNDDDDSEEEPSHE